MCRRELLCAWGNPDIGYLGKSRQWYLGKSLAHTGIKANFHGNEMATFHACTHCTCAHMRRVCTPRVHACTHQLVHVHMYTIMQVLLLVLVLLVLVLVLVLLVLVLVLLGVRKLQIKKACKQKINNNYYCLFESVEFEQLLLTEIPSLSFCVDLLLKQTSLTAIPLPCAWVTDCILLAVFSRRRAFYLITLLCHTVKSIL